MSVENPSESTQARGGVRELASRASRLASTFNLLGLIVAVCALFIYFKIKLPDTFLTFSNMETIAIQATITSTAALGMTLVIIAAGIDLSVGSGVALITVVVALSLANHSPWFAVLMGLAAGGLCGLFNG
ncbi:MAG TPA: hypothetical protein VMI31_04520, partial [Fimbriimonadaceae bacterium]|nr:hypothetical protein [Fimbriimonadaceae bacterium]